MSGALAALQSALPELPLSTDPGDLDHYGRDWTRRWPPAPLAVARPGRIDEVQAIVRWAGEQAIAIVPSGGRTGLSGGAVAARGELVLSLERMNKVLAFDAIDRTLSVQAGITLAAAQQAAGAQDLYYPVDFAARGSCTIGGNIATNAGGIRVLRHGNTREWVAGLKAVAADGSLLDLNRGLVKNASGYDLRHLLIGSEGTLGVIVEASLRLTAPPPPSQVMLLALPELAALMPVFKACRQRLSLSAFEFFTDRALHHVLAAGAQAPFADSHPVHALVEFDVDDDDAQSDSDHDGQARALALFEHGLEQGWIADGVISHSQADAAALWRLREGITEALAPHRPYKNDISMRISAIPGFMTQIQALFARDYPGFDVIWFGHIGDGNLHINILPPERMSGEDFLARCEQVTGQLSRALAACGGSISAEHGIGLVKKPWLGDTRSAAEIAWMRAMRTALDPAGLFNPGKLFDP
ncbi:MAG: FAD-binding oxidoreductase [Xanthomonadales bacterium]|nr:FAD-binding oxidoreductase [Xanthomonadales bacterium]